MLTVLTLLFYYRLTDLSIKYSALHLQKAITPVIPFFYTTNPRDPYEND